MRTLGLVGIALALLGGGCGDDSAAGDGGARDGAVADTAASDTSVDASPPPGAVGTACTADTDCLAGLTCFTGPEGARAWPGGYCTRDCSAASDCPGGSVCGLAYDDGERSHNLCQAACSREAGSRGGCRAGYRCGYQGFCTIGCSSDDECRTDDTYPGPPYYDPGSTCELSSGRCLHGTVPSVRDGDSCASNRDCRPPSGHCILGHCFSTNCDLGGDYACSDGQVCVGWGTGFDSVVRVCMASCRVGVDGLGGAAGDRCVTGFSCAPPEADASGTATDPFCMLKVGGVGQSSTATIGSPCSSVADCPEALGYSQCVSGSCVAQYCAAPSLADEDICGPGATCLASAPDRENGGWQSVQQSLGLCLRDCSADATVCEAPSSCMAGLCGAL